MIRLSIALLHTAVALASATLTAGYLTWVQATWLWERTFYNALSPELLVDLALGLLAAVAATSHAFGAGAYFYGTRWGAWVMALWTATHLFTLPKLLLWLGLSPWLTPVVWLPLALTTLLALGDTMVMVYRQRSATP